MTVHTGPVGGRGFDRPAVLRDYALLADGERGALVDPGRAITWLCFPSWDSPAVFAGLVGGGGGYQVQPAAPAVWGGHYEPVGLVWRQRWTTTTGRVECREALALPGRPDQVTILRRVSVTGSSAAVRVRLALRADFGATGVRDLRRGEDGCWRGRLAGGSFCFAGAAQAQLVQTAGHDDLEMELAVEPSQAHDLVLTLSTGSSADSPAPDEAWRAVEAGWSQRLAGVPTAGTAARDVRHAHAVLHGLTSASGADGRRRDTGPA